MLAWLLASTGCAGGPPRGATEPAAERVPPAHEAGVAPSVGTYELTDAVWLEGVPVAVNQDFDFATAMSLETIGPGLAASQRRRANEEKARALREVALAEGTLARVAALRASGRKIYGLLWGAADAAALRVVIEDARAPGPAAAQRVVVSETRPMAGASGWAAPAVLDRAFSAALDRMAVPAP